MEALYVLLVFSLLLGCGFLLAFFWAHGSGQFDDAETPALRMLFDDVRQGSHKMHEETSTNSKRMLPMQSFQNEKIGGT